MALTFETNHTVIVAFIFTVIALCVATMFLSCFGKKKDKKKGKKGKSPSPPPAPKPQDVKNAKTELAVDVKASPNLKAADEAEDLGDFSAVQRETEILRSYRKPPPPKNRARQSRAPRTFKDSTENLDIFSEINDESTLQLSYTSQQDETDREEPKSPAPRDESESPSAKHDTSLGRSSMLDDIELTLATLSTETKKEVTDVHTGISKSIEDAEKKVTTVKETVTTEKEVVEKQIKKNEATLDLNVAPVIIHTGKTVKEDIKETVTVKLEKAKNDVEDKTVSSVTEVKESIEKKTVSNVSAGISTLEDVKVEMENKADIRVGSPDAETSEKKDAIPAEQQEKKHTIHEDLSDKFGHVGEQIKTNITSVITDAQETVKNKFGGAIAAITENDKEEKREDEKDEINKDETKINGTITELEKTSSLLQDRAESPKTEIKIPPKVSPKPSPKNPRPLLTKSDAIQISSSLDSTNSKDEPSLEPKEEPASPTSPVSPTQTKSQSRIPMSKKTSAIPKLSFSSSKSSSVSPLSSPDSSTGKKVETIPVTIQKESNEILDKVKELADKATHDPTHNNQESNARDSKEKSPEPEKNNSPFERENRGSKSRLTKLRYSGRKPPESKSADSKSDESESDRGSRAGSEAKSEDGKKLSEDASEQDKTSRIPVRAGSKPRSSPPKALE